MDWATQNHWTQKPEPRDVYSTGFPLYPDSAIHVALRCSFQGWWCNEEKELSEHQAELLAQISDTECARGPKPHAQGSWL